MTKVFTLGELHGRSDSELQTLFRMVSTGAANSKPNSNERYAHFATLENTRKTLDRRRQRLVKPAVGF